MRVMLIIRRLTNNFKILVSKIKKQNESAKYCFATKDIYYSEDKNAFYFKIATLTGYLCWDILVDELLANQSILFALDKASFAYAHYVAGKLESLANSDLNSIYTFYGISPNDITIFLVKSTVNLSVHQWDIFDAFEKELYLKLDKPSIVRFVERYIIAKQIFDDKNDKLRNNLRVVK